MSKTWSNLVGLIVNFSSGLIWDKLNLIANNHDEILIREHYNLDSRANGWLQIRKGSYY